MTTLDRVCSHFGLSLPPATSSASPIELTNIGRSELPRLFHALNFTEGAEVGVEVGRYSKELCAGNPGVHLYCVDPWQSYRGYREHVSQDKLDGFFQTTKDRLVEHNCTFVRKFSVAAAKDFAKHSLDFVYIDANHALEYVIADIAAWAPIVKPGGILAGHDYARRGGKGYQCHVIEAVHAWTASYGIHPWFVIGSLDALPGASRPEPRSWMWVVPE